jgi:uncharacterized damage-inducible protein DinB
MAGNTIARPASTEYVPYYATYVDQVPEGDILGLLRRQVEETAGMVAPLSDRDAEFRYAEGKWSIKEVIGHVADVERIFVYRALCFARGEPVALPGFDENEYARQSNAGSRPLKDLVDELRTVRAATLSFFAGLSEKDLLRRGTANRNGYSVRSFAFIIAGHERHHVKILRERYLGGLERQ